MSIHNYTYLIISSYVEYKIYSELDMDSGLKNILVSKSVNRITIILSIFSE